MKYFSTISDGVTNLLEYEAVGLVDGILAVHCNSNGNKVEPKQTWMKQALDENQQHKQWYTGQCFEDLHFSKTRIQHVKQHFNHSGGRYSLHYVNDLAFLNSDHYIKATAFFLITVCILYISGCHGSPQTNRMNVNRADLI